VTYNNGGTPAVGDHVNAYTDGKHYVQWGVEHAKVTVVTPIGQGGSITVGWDGGNSDTCTATNNILVNVYKVA